MVEHLTREQIAALLDEPEAVGLAHLDVCEDCAGEFEAMSRTRMALSALPAIAAPDGAWNRIRRSLPDLPAEPEGPRAKRATSWWSPDSRWGPFLNVAAILVLFLGGLAVGRMLVPAGAGSGGEAGAGVETVPASTATRDAGTDEQAGYEEYLRTVVELQELRAGGPSLVEIERDPALAAERLTRLDALIEASREALRTAPADPALNDFLFDVVDERAEVADRLDQTIRHASLEY